MSSMLGTDYFAHVMQRSGFDKVEMPSLLYITKQQAGGKKRDRPMHGHDSLCEILLVYRGVGSYATRNRTYPIQAGDILFYNQDEAHEVRAMSDEEIGTYCFGIGNLHLKDLPPNHMIPSDSSPVRSAGAMLGFFEGLCEHAYQMLDEDPMHRAVAQCLAFAFLLSAIGLEDETPGTVVSVQDTQMGDRIREYLDIHYTEPIDLKSIAAAFQCSEPYISHVFKKAMGYSPIQYVIRRRVGLAQTYLISSDYTATQIATLVGYDNTNYFNTIFTKVVGVSPIRYKKQYIEALHGNVMQ